MQLRDFRLTHRRIAPYIRRTPLVQTDWPGIFLKLENLQVTHSFKVRGAFARILDLVESNDPRTILTVSAGNHGQAVARAASTFERPCTVIVPQSAPKAKIEAIRRYGVNLRVEGRNYDEAEALTLDLAGNAKEFVFVSPYNDPHVVLGQGTLALEILEQKPETATVVVSIGGGGLAAGVAAAAKQAKPSVRVIGVQAEVSAAMYHSLKAGHMVAVEDRPSIADGIQGNIDLATITFPIIHRWVDDVVLVSEESIRSAMASLLKQEKLLTEGSAAAAVAACLEGKVPSGSTVVVVSGGNVDFNTISNCINP